MPVYGWRCTATDDDVWWWTRMSADGFIVDDDGLWCALPLIMDIVYEDCLWCIMVCDDGWCWFALHVVGLGRMMSCDAGWWWTLMCNLGVLVDGDWLCCMMLYGGVWWRLVMGDDVLRLLLRNDGVRWWATRYYDGLGCMVKDMVCTMMSYDLITRGDVGWWCMMVGGDGWWLMLMYDDGWCCCLLENHGLRLMICDDGWWLCVIDGVLCCMVILMLVYEGWRWGKLYDDGRWWLMIYHDGLWLAMMG